MVRWNKCSNVKSRAIEAAMQRGLAKADLPALATLRLSGTGLSGPGVQALATAPILSRVRTLSLGEIDHDRAAIAALVSSPHLRELRSLSLRVAELGLVLLLFSDAAARFLFEEQEGFVKRMVKLLQRVPEIPASAEFSLRRCFYHEGDELREGFYVTCYVFGYGGDDAKARQQWSIALNLVGNALRQLNDDAASE